MLLVGRQKGHLACKKTEWRGAPADATATALKTSGDAGDAG